MLITICLHDLQNIQDSLWYSILKDFVFPFVFTSIGALVAWLVFFRQIIIDKKKEKDAKNENLKNKLTFFTMIVHNALDNVKGQNSYVKVLIKDLREKQNEILVLYQYPTYDLKIIAEKIDIEDYLLSYLAFYSTKSKINILKEFKEIVDNFAIINDIFIQIQNDLKSRHAFLTDLSAKYHNLTEECADLLGLCLKNLKEDRNPLFTRFFEVHNIQNKAVIRENDIIKAQYIYFIKPLLELLDSLHTEKIEFNDVQGNLWIASGKASNIYNNIISESVHHATRATEDFDLVNKLISKIETASENLRKDFLN